MPLYEGIGLIGEKHQHPVILDIGAVYTKCGLGGEPTPRVIFPTNEPLDQLSDEQALHNSLLRLLHRVYFQHLLVNPKTHAVVVVESFLCASVLRDTLAKVLFNHLEVPSCLFVLSHVVAMLTAGTQTGLVVDLAHAETSVVPVFNGVPLLAASQAVPLAARSVQLAIGDAMRRHATVIDTSRSQPGSQLSSSDHSAGDTQTHTPIDQQLPELCDSVLEDLQVRVCVVAGIKFAETQAAITKSPPPDTPPPPPPPSSSSTLYTLPGGMCVSVPRRVRHEPAELLFQPHDADNVTVTTAVLDALMHCPIDLRRPLAANLMLIGGLAQMRGIKARLLAELRKHIQLPPYADVMSSLEFKIHQPPCKDIYTAWLGGSLFGDTDVIFTRSLTREKYIEKSGSIPDWCSLATPRPIRGL